jgi:hypothetical protein
MRKNKVSTIAVRGTAISIVTGKDGDYISLTDMLRAKDGEFFISGWLRNRNTVEFLGIWESVFNPDFNYGEFATIKPLEFERFGFPPGSNPVEFGGIRISLTRESIP